MGLKLYRGISATEFELLSSKSFKESRKSWEKILSRRAANKLDYPIDMDKEIVALAKVARLERQHFTDNQAIAYSYARKTKGMLISIDVPIKEVLKNFRLEFQNFGLRKKAFEIVYVIDAQVLAKHQRHWKLKAKQL